MECLFGHTTTELSERLKDTLKPLLSDPSSELSKKLQNETKIKIFHNKIEDTLIFSGTFSTIVLTNDIILAHLEQIKQQINYFLSEQVTFSVGNEIYDGISDNSHHRAHTAVSSFASDHVDQNVCQIPSENETENFQNVQLLYDSTNQKNEELTNNTSFLNVNSHAFGSSDIEILPLTQTYQEQIEYEQVTIQLDTCKEIHNTKVDKDIKTEIARREHPLSSFGQHIDTNLECKQRGSDELREKDISNYELEEEKSIDEQDENNTQLIDRSNPTSHYNLRNAKPSSVVKKILKLESIDTDEGETEDDDEDKSDPEYNPDQFDINDEDESRKEHDSNFKFKTDCNFEQGPEYCTSACDKDEEMLPDVLNQTKENKEDANNHYNSITEDDNHKEQNTGKFSSNKHSGRAPRGKKAKKKDLNEKTKNWKFMDKNDLVLEEPVLYRKEKIGTCARDKKDPSMAKSSCNLCTYVNSAKYRNSKYHLGIHFSRNHVKRELKFDCLVCGKKFGTKGDLHVHSLYHTYKKCEECGKMIQRRTFPLHAKRHNPAYNSNRFECDICNRKFTTKVALKYHIETFHNAEKRDRFPCDVCGKLLASKFSLRKHKSSVHGTKNKNYLCDICGKAFHTAEYVRTHQQIHSEVPQHICSICLKAFRWKEGLKIHMKTHSDEKKFICPEPDCRKPFKHHGSLKRHMLIHTGERPYECNLCKKTFNDSSILRRHMIGKHQEKR